MSDKLYVSGMVRDPVEYALKTLYRMRGRVGQDKQLDFAIAALEELQFDSIAACPFCDTTEFLVVSRSLDPGLRGDKPTRVRCDNCGSSGPEVYSPDNKSHDAIRAWSKRGSA